MAAIFTVTWMQRDNELVAMLAAGISAHRVIRPVLVCAVLISGLAIANQELIIPKVARELQLPPDDDGERQLKVYARTDINDIVIHGTWGFRDTQSIANPPDRQMESAFDATLPESRFGTLHNLEAREARYIPESAIRSPLRGGWLLFNARLSPLNSEPDGTLLIEVDPEDLKDFPPPRTPMEKIAGGKCYFLRTNVDFDTATRSLQWYQYASTSDLVRTLASPIGDTERTEIGVFLHTRLLRPALTLSLLLITLPIVMGSSTRGMFINLGFSLGTSATFYTVLFFFQYLGNNRAFGITPELAAWAPLIGFAGVSALRWDSIRT